MLTKKRWALFKEGNVYQTFSLQQHILKINVNVMEKDEFGYSYSDLVHHEIPGFKRLDNTVSRVKNSRRFEETFGKYYGKRS